MICKSFFLCVGGGRRGRKEGLGREAYQPAVGKKKSSPSASFGRRNVTWEREREGGGSKY